MKEEYRASGKHGVKSRLACLRPLGSQMRTKGTWFPKASLVIIDQFGSKATRGEASNWSQGSLQLATQQIHLLIMIITGFLQKHSQP